MGTVKERGLGGYRTQSKWMYSHPNLWTWFVKELGVASVLDVGCAEGHAIHFFKEMGCDVVGVDGCKYAYNHCIPAIKNNFILHNYCEGPLKIDKDYDLVWSREFVEHVEGKYRDNYLVTFQAAKKYLCMTTPLKVCTRGYHHVNCQDPDYWIDFLKNDFDYSPDLTKKAQEITLKGTKISEDILKRFPEIVCYKDLKNTKDIGPLYRRFGKPTGMVFVRKEEGATIDTGKID